MYTKLNNFIFYLYSFILNNTTWQTPAKKVLIHTSSLLTIKGIVISRRGYRGVKTIVYKPNRTLPPLSKEPWKPLSCLESRRNQVALFLFLPRQRTHDVGLKVICLEWERDGAGGCSLGRNKGVEKMSKRLWTLIRARKKLYLVTFESHWRRLKLI